MNWLKNKKTQILFFLFSALIFFILYNINTYKFTNLEKSFYDAFFAISLVNIIFSFLTVFVISKVWRVWFKVNIILSIIGFIIVFFSSPSPEFLMTLRELITICYWILYSLISLGIIIYQSFRK